VIDSEPESAVGVGLCKSCTWSTDVGARCGDDGVGAFVSGVESGRRGE
jgi:hypothetical protein